MGGGLSVKSVSQRKNLHVCMSVCRCISQICCVVAINSALLSLLLTASFADAPAEIPGVLDTFSLNNYPQN